MIERGSSTSHPTQVPDRQPVRNPLDRKRSPCRIGRCARSQGSRSSVRNRSGEPPVNPRQWCAARRRRSTHSEVRAWAKSRGVPVIDCKAGERKLIGEEYLAEHAVGAGVFMVLVAPLSRPPEAARTITALSVLRDQVMNPILAGVRSPRQAASRPPRRASTATTNPYASTCRPSSPTSPSSPRPHRQRFVDKRHQARRVVVMASGSTPKP